MKGSKGPKHSHKVTVTSVVVSVLLRLHKQAQPANQRIERLGRAAGARVAPTHAWTTAGPSALPRSTFLGARIP